MKRITLITLLFAMTAVAAYAVPPNRSLDFTGSAMGKVHFDGKIHNEAAESCKTCHNPDLFPKMRQGTVTITMEEIYAGKLCGNCHNGERAFAAKQNCTRCHVR